MSLFEDAGAGAPTNATGTAVSGTIKDAGTNTASDKVFVLGDTIGAGGSGTTKTFTAS